MMQSVHPHGRGDDVLLFLALLNYIGSPPRAWGRLVLCCHLEQFMRFTPTGVGTTIYI